MDNSEEYHNIKTRLEHLERENSALRINESKHKHLQKVYACLMRINRLAASETDREIFVQKVCRALTELRSYYSAWIALFDKDGKFESVFSSGLEDLQTELQDFFESSKLPDCCKMAFESSEVLIETAPADKCLDCPLSHAYSGRHAMSARIEYGNKIFGIITVSIPPDFLDDDELKLFAEILSDVGLALNNLQVGEDSRKFEFIVKTLPQTFSLLSTDYRYIIVNDIYKELFVIQIEDIVGKSVADFFDPVVFDGEIKPMLDRCRNGEEVEYELDVNFKTLGQRRMHMYYFPYIDENGDIVGIISHGVDVTKQRTAEINLGLSEIKYKYLVETAADSITLITEDGIITEVNEFALRICDRCRSEMIGQPVSVMDPNYTASEFKSFWKKIPLNVQNTFESSHVKSDGTTFPVEVSGKKVQLDDKVYIISIARDITETKRYSKKLIEAAKKAEEADRLKSAFLANMSHEIRTPLNGILGFASLLNDPEITVDLQEKYYSIISQSGQRLLSTINDLIDISRIETGIIETEITAFDLNILFDEIFSFFKPEFTKKSVEFKLNKALEKTPATINTDRDKLYAIVTNLIKNAVKFTDKGFVVLGYEKTSGGFRLYVTDTGIGISKDKITSIFNRFIQADSSLTKSYEGSGLGLAISKELVEILGGTMEVESILGQGTTFSVMLPWNLK